ncbi:MAG: beta-N-acetylhexosaminidase [Cyclobacteriaceae bacterium]|jgi:hexosaminidase
MKFLCIAFIFSFLYSEALFGQFINIIPYPDQVEQKEGHFILNSNTVIVPDEYSFFRAKQLKRYLEPATGFDIEIEQSERKSNLIIVKKIESLKYLGEEGYHLEITQNRIQIEAYHSKGLFYAIQTLIQLLPVEIYRKAKVENVDWILPSCKIIDTPQYEWRGLMIDYSRTFWNKRITKKYIDAMALYKLNKLHMHLTDDQGWRIEILRYPDLTRIASKFDTSYHEPQEREGFFNQSDIKEIIQYASERNVEIIPEIEMPGHSSEVFAVYPELSCKGETMKIHPFVLGPGIHKEIYCAGNDSTFIFLKNVLSEVFKLFPSTYIHIGGDEAPKDHWKDCSRCQQRLAEEGLKDEYELQSWFIKQIESHISANQKIMIGWDEIVEGGLSGTATVMYWRGWEKSVPELVLENGNNIIMTPTSHCYFDYTYESISSEHVYSYNPVPESLDGIKTEQILGVQANFWSHLNRIEPEMDRQIFPRLLALAEVGWLKESDKNWGDFSLRLKHHKKVLEILDIYYFKEK